MGIDCRRLTVDHTFNGQDKFMAPFPSIGPENFLYDLDKHPGIVFRFFKSDIL